MNELRALVEECGVVFVRFDYEERAAGMASRGRKIERNAANQKPGGSPGALEDPGQHGRNRGFAMGAGHGEHMAPGEHMLCEPLGPRDILLAPVEDRLHERVTPRDHIADQPKVRPQCDLLLAEALDQLDAEPGKLLAHRRVDVSVAAGHTVAGGARDGGNVAHESAANTEDVQVLGHDGEPPILVDDL